MSVTNILAYFLVLLATACSASSCKCTGAAKHRHGLAWLALQSIPALHYFGLHSSFELHFQHPDFLFRFSLFLQHFTCYFSEQNDKQSFTDRMNALLTGSFHFKCCFECFFREAMDRAPGLSVAPTIPGKVFPGTQLYNT